MEMIEQNQQISGLIAQHGSQERCAEIINMINADIGSTGGGRDDLAQAGLEYNGKVSDMVTIIKNNILQLMQSKEN